jgi:hypothetical protein
MNILNFLSRLTGRPPLLPNGYPDMARNHRYIDGDDEIIQDVTRRINGGRQRAFHMIPPPPPMEMYPSYSEPPEPPMVAEIVNKISREPVRTTPSTTSSLWCGTTITDITSTLTAPKDPLVLDHLPLKHFLVKKYPWILDVTEVRIKPLGRLTHPIYESTIVYGPLEIHITVSPTHHSELMNPKIEKKVREKLYVDLLSLITCMYENNHKDKPIIIFSPSHSETILEHVK